MTFLSLKDLQELLKNVPKEIIIRMYHDFTKFRNKEYVVGMIRSVKMELNLEKQHEVLDLIDKLPQVDHTNVVGWLHNHDKWTKLNKELELLWVEFEKLSKVGKE